MPNKTNIELNDSWVCGRLSNVTDKDLAWVLVQEPAFIGFGVVSPNEICWPPYKESESEKESEWEPDWTLTSDLRLFGEKGEWHVWRDWDGKHYARLLEFDAEDEQHVWIDCNGNDQDNPEKSRKKREALTEYHALWGTRLEKTDTPPWIKLTEKRGTEIWLPLKGQVQDNKNGNAPLLCLKLKQVVDYDKKYHLAGIVDAALIGLVRSSDKENQELLLPTNSCS